MKAINLLTGLLCLSSCAEQAKKPELPNILWITNEDTGPIWGCYGDDYASTPNIDALAGEGYVFQMASSNAPISAPARSTLITGMYATSLGTQHLRSEIPVPDGLKILPEHLREAGYFTTNNFKTDYNFSAEGRWDENGRAAHWRNAPEGKPFFSVFNFAITHEGYTNNLRKEDTETLLRLHDPGKAELPPYFPETEKLKEIWAHLYDLVSVFDQEVGKLIAQLKEDGEYDNTIIFVFSDHGHGLPRNKRWLYNSGVQVPFVLHVPERYKHLVSNLQGQKVEQMVSFVDFAPTVLSLAGIEAPEMMEGQIFLGKNSTAKEYLYGYRDRADDCYDMARSVTDGRYIYVRHFMPQLPYYQSAVIFNKQGSYEEINRLRELGSLPDETMAMFAQKPVEVLFDLKNDPFEQDNLINGEEHQALIDTFRDKLDQWMLKHYDTGLLNEGQYMEMARAANTSVYETVRNLGKEKMAGLLKAAGLVGKVENPEVLMPLLQSDDNNVCYWGLVATDAFEGDISQLKPILKKLLFSESNVVASFSAAILIKNFRSKEAYRRMGELLMYDYEPVVLQTAIQVRNLDTLAEPLLPVIREEVYPNYAGNVWGRYKNWSYPMFIGMALDQVRITCGDKITIDGKQN